MNLDKPYDPVLLSNLACVMESTVRLGCMRGVFWIDLEAQRAAERQAAKNFSKTVGVFHNVVTWFPAH